MPFQVPSSLPQTDGSLDVPGEAQGEGAQEQAESMSSVLEPTGGVRKQGAYKDLEGSVCFVPVSQLSTIEWLSGATLGAMPQVSGATLGAMPQVSGATLGAMPQVSGATLGAMPQVSGATLGAMPQVSGATLGAMPQVSGATSCAMPQVSGAISEVGAPGQSSAAWVDETGIDTAGSMCSGPGSTGTSMSHIGQECPTPSTQRAKVSQGESAQGGYAAQGPRLKSLRFSPSPSLATQLKGGQARPEKGESNEIVGRRGNVNLLLGYERVGRSIVSLLGGEEVSLYSLGTSSVATMYRVAGATRQEVARCSDPKRTPRCNQDQSAAHLCMGSRQAAVDPPSQISSVRSNEGSPEAVGDCRQPDVEAQEFPCSRLVWFVLLKKGALREYAGSQGIGQLVIGSEGLNTLGWGLGVSSLSERVSDSLSDPSANAFREPTLSQGPTVGTKGQGDKVSVCKHYIKGWCRKGQSCGFPHLDISAGSGTSAHLSQGDKEGARKVCPHFLKGNCLRGETCGYAHSRYPAPVDQAGAKQDSKQQAEGVQLRCPHFAKGFCRRGDTCKFTHDSGNLDPKESPPRPEVDRRVKHQPLAQSKKNQLREAGLLDICFRWAQGRCDTTSCRFSHRPLGQWEIKLFRELLDNDHIQPEALPTGDQAPATTCQEGDGQEQPQQQRVREGHPWDVTVPLLQPAPLILEPSIPDKCRLSAPRPRSSLRKAGKVSMPGSTILRRKLGDHSSTRVMPLSSQSSQQTSRSVLTQPCVLASPPGQPEKRLQRPRTWCRLKVSRSRISGSLKNEFTPVKGGRFPLSSYVSNPPGTRPKPLIASSNKDVTTPIKSKPGKQSVFRKAWADMSDSDSSEEEPVACELPPLLSQVESSSGRQALTGFSTRTHRRLRQYAFWKLRKGHCHKCPKELNTCSKSSSGSQSIAFYHDSSSLPRFVNESALENNNGAGEGNCSSANVVDRGPRAHGPGESQDNAAVSRCILRAVWSRVAVRGTGLHHSLAVCSCRTSAVHCL